jgi:hypothetical protein
MQQADEKKLVLSQLVENQVAFKADHAKTSNGGLLQIFAAAPDLRLAGNEFQCTHDAIFETDEKC